MFLFLANINLFAITKPRTLGLIIEWLNFICYRQKVDNSFSKNF